GFSQGGALALYAGLSASWDLAGIIGLSTYLPVVADDRWMRTPAPPLFLAHGTADPVIPLDTAERTRLRLKARGIDPAWSTWPMGHAVHPQELEQLAQWVRRVAPH
ncbi:MAG TPA: hypothetical protein VFN52_00345, partial [Acidiferrobacteraceae bacterium]|nr:hypothetical protein [Acidiferrobacteraceae bacterium]